MPSRPSDQPLPLYDILQRRDRPQWVWFISLLCIGLGVGQLLVDGGSLAVTFFVGDNSTIVLPPIFAVAHVVIPFFGLILGFYLLLIGVETVCGARVGGRPHRIYARIRIAIALFEVLLLVLMYHQAAAHRSVIITLLYAAMASLQWVSEGIIYLLIL